MADSLLALYPDVDLIFAHNDRMAIAAADVAARRGLVPYIIGIDAAPEIGMKAVSEGRIDATFLYPTEGYRLIRTALDILEGRPYERVVRLPAPSLVERNWKRRSTIIGTSIPYSPRSSMSLCRYSLSSL